MKKTLKLTALLMAFVVLTSTFSIIACGTSTEAAAVSDEVSELSSGAPLYGETAVESYSDKITAFEFNIPVLPQSDISEYTEIVTLEKATADNEYLRQNLIYADLQSRVLAIKTEGEIYELCDSEGKALTLSSKATPIAVVYDDINGDARFFVNGIIAHININGNVALAADLKLDSAFVGVAVKTEKVILFEGFENTPDKNVTASSYSLSTHNVNSDDTIKLIGFQENSTTDGMRIIAGVDTIYYTNVGFEIEAFDGGVSTGTSHISGNKVFSSVTANDKTLTAEENGHKYLAVATITDIINSIKENSFIIVRAYTEIENIRHYDQEAQIIVTSDGYYFGKSTLLYENNFNSVTSLPDKWVGAEANPADSLVGIKNGELCLGAPNSTSMSYYLDKNLGSNYVVQGDFRIISNTSDTRWASLMLRVQDSDSYIIAGVRMNGEWFIESNDNGTWFKHATGNSGIEFYLAQTYTLSAVCYGDSVALFIDGILVGEATVPQKFVSGGVGISLSGMELRADDFTVRSVTDKYDGKLICKETFDNLPSIPEEWGRLESATTSDSNLTLSIQDGALRIHDMKASRLVICNERELSGNYVFEAELCAEELANATRYMGIVFGAQDDGSLIAVDMRMSDGRILFESFDPATNKWTSLTTQAKYSTNPALRTFYKFKIECVNGYAVFYADGVKYARFEIPEKFLSGKVGIILSQCAVHVDNVRIFEVGEHAVPDSAPEPIYEYIEVPTYTESFDGLTAVPTGWDKMTTATTTPANLTVSAENDALVISDMKSAIAAVSLDQTFSGNYTVEADIALTSRANDTRYMGVLIGVQEDDSFAGCQIRLSDGRFELTKWDSTSKWANIGETVYLKDKLTLELGTAYHFKLVCTDGYATAYVNDINCGGFTIPEKHLSGKIGFITSQATVSVDNISVKTITKYEATPIYEENFEYVHSVPEEWSDTATSSPLKMSADGEKLILKNTTGRSIVALSEELDGNFMYEAELTLTQKHTSDSWWLGPVFGLQEDGTYVLFDANIVSRKWSATPWNGKSWDAALAKPATADEYVNNIGVNIPQKFKLICLDGTGTIIINGVKICSFEIPEKFLSGKVGIGFRNSTVEVDNVRICKLAVGTDYTTLYDHSFNGLTSLPAEWSKNTAATLSNSTLEISTDKEGLILKDAKGQRTVVALDKTLDGGDFIYELDLTMTERHDTDVTGTSWWMGPAFGIHDDGSFAIMDVKILNGQWYVEPWLGTKWGTAFVKASTSADYISTFRLGVLQHFKLVCVDGIATASINGVEICTFELPEEYRTGKVGVGFRNSTVVIDNVKLQKLDKDEKGLNISAQTLTDATLSLGENHVMHNKTLSVKFDLSELADGQAVTVGHGDSAVKITNTTVTSYNGNTSVYNAEHGLDVSGNIEVIIDSDYGTATARIKRSDNTAFVTPSFAWSGRDGEIFISSEDVTLENVKMNWNSTEHGNNVWIVGDSCLDINSDTSFAYYLGKGGLSLIGSCDETSTTAVTEFENALKHGSPEYAVWVMGMNEADGDNAVNAAWKTAVDEFLALCEDNGVTPVLCTMPGTNHSFKNSVVTDSGYRYIDLAKADGAEAMYKEILMDFTEIKESMGGTRIRVATFNTGNFTGAGLTKGAEKTVAAYRELFESVNADLWGLQEDEQFVDNAYPATEGTTPYDAIYKNILPHHKGFFTGKYKGKAFLTKFNLYDVEQVYYPAPDTSYTSSVYHYGHRWFLTGKIEVDGKEISLVSLHFDWNCKERRATQIQEVIKFAKEQEYCIIMGDFNPEDYLNGVEISKNLFYEEELALFREIGMTHANAGEFGLFDTLVEPTQPELYGPWDNIIVSSNIRLLSAEKVYVDWMIDHAVVVAEMELN